MGPSHTGDFGPPTAPVPSSVSTVARRSTLPPVGPDADGQATGVGRVGAWLTAARRSRRRQVLLAAALIVMAGTVLSVVDPFSSPAATSATGSYSTYTIKRQTISSQTLVSATLGYSGSYTVTVPSGTSSQNLTQAQEAVTADQAKVQSDESGGTAATDAASVTSDQQALSADQASQQADQATLQTDQSALAADQQQETNDCAGSGSTSQACSADEQKVGSDQQKVAQDQQKVAQDQQKVSQDQAKLAQDQAKQAQDSSQSQSNLAADQQKLADDQAALAAAEQQATIPTGAFSQLPAVGQVVTQGQTLYTVGTTPVVLLYGATPATRNLYQGESGPDVAQLNDDLRALGYATAPTGDTFTAGTTTAVDAFEAHIGVPETGNLALGQVVFLPGPARVTAVNANLGGNGQPGASVLTASSTGRQVTIALDATLQADVKVGDPVTVTLPDQNTTPGVVSYVGTVATTPSNSGNGGGGGSSTPTIEVDVRLTDPSAAGNLDQAPVNVAITNNTAPDALVVPVNALLALASGGYALEVVPASGPHHLVPVSTGLFDDAQGLVQVTGSQVQEGMRVVVPSS